MNRSYVASLVGLLALASGTGVVAGCAPPPVAEARGTTSAKLLAPLAVFKGAASATTTATFGISQWRIFRGKKQFVVTGYDAKGKAVHGAGMSFVQHTATNRAKLQGRIFDGSGFTATHEFGGATAGTALPAVSRSFATAAVSDLVQLRQGLTTSITRSAIPTGAACNGDLVKIAISALQCIATATTGSSACQAAALSAANAVLSCASVGTIHNPFNSGASSSGSTTGASGSTASNSGASTGTSGSTASTSSSGSTATDQKATDAAQDAAQDAADAKLEAADAKQDAEQDAADDKQAAADKAQDAQQDKQDDAQTAADAKQDAEQDAADSANADKAASGGECTSCGVGAGDIQANPQNGDVSVADAGDTGGGDMSEALLSRPRHLSRDGLSIEFT